MCSGGIRSSTKFAVTVEKLCRLSIERCGVVTCHEWTYYLPSSVLLQNVNVSYAYYKSGTTNRIGIESKDLITPSALRIAQ